MQTHCPHSLPPNHIPYLIAVLRTILKPHITIEHKHKKCIQCTLQERQITLNEIYAPPNPKHYIAFADNTRMTHNMRDPYDQDAPPKDYPQVSATLFYQYNKHPARHESAPGQYPIFIHACKTVTEGQYFDEIEFDYDPKNHEAFVEQLYTCLVHVAHVWRAPRTNNQADIDAYCHRPEYPIRPWDEVKKAPMNITEHKRKAKNTALKARRTKLAVQDRKCHIKGCRWKAMPNIEGCLMHHKRGGRPKGSSSKPSSNSHSPPR